MMSPKVIAFKWLCQFTRRSPLKVFKLSCSMCSTGIHKVFPAQSPGHPVTAIQVGKQNESYQPNNQNPLSFLVESATRGTGFNSRHNINSALLSELWQLCLEGPGSKASKWSAQEWELMGRYGEAKNCCCQLMVFQKCPTKRKSMQHRPHCALLCCAPGVQVAHLVHSRHPWDRPMAWHKQRSHAQPDMIRYGSRLHTLGILSAMFHRKSV